LLNHMFNGFALADRHRDGAVVLTRVELALNEDVSAFDSGGRPLVQSLCRGRQRVPLRLACPSPFSPFQDFFVATENFTTGVGPVT
jgi:hypothetical protein